MPELTVGDPAPDFDLAASGGGRLRLADFAGRMLVLYFYPKDDTPGCTVQAIDFTAVLPELEQLGATVVGVSKDSVASHDKFTAKHGLKIALASDPEGSMIDAYGAWGEKSMYGKKYMGIERSTVLVGPDGKVRRVWPKVRPAGHANEVLEEVRALAEGSPS